MKNLKHIIVVPRQIAEKGFGGELGNYGLISICDHGFQEVAPATDKPCATLRLEFVDWDINRSPEIQDEAMFGVKIKDALIRPEHGERVAAFLLEHGEAEILVIHCLAGVSRSVSTAQAICDAFGLTRDIITIYSGRNKFGPPPNQMVYHTMFTALTEKKP